MWIKSCTYFLFNDNLLIVFLAVSINKPVIRVNVRVFENMQIHANIKQAKALLKKNPLISDIQYS